MANRLTSAECARLGSLAASLDCAQVRVYRSDRRGFGRLLRRIVLWLSRNRAIALGNHIFLPARQEDDVATLAHEVTHCRQYQAWGPWTYYSRGAAAQLRHLLHRTLGVGASPYHYTAIPGRPFQSYGMEQQGQIVEDCFRGHPDAQALSPYRPGRSA
jgi:Domain of unknown function (DUF4157)